jgi:adenosylcobinamide kinase/adenosylcobinamide-phosphate guanylyltransferase
MRVVIPVRRVLALGGVRSGKSRYAESLASDDGRAVTVVATATAGDAEMEARIAAHRARRPVAWSLVEEPVVLAATLRQLCQNDRVVIVECLTLWITELLCATDAALVERETEALIETIPTLPGGLILVSNEVGFGVLPLGNLTRRFVDTAGALHQRLATLCDHVVLLVAGRPLSLKG